MNSGFQTQVTTQPAPGVEGDFCSTNPRYSVLAGPGGLVAGPLGCVVARFAWAVDPDDADGAPATVITNGGSGAVAGFIHREQQALIEVYLQISSMLVPAGFPITVMSGGDFWARNAGSGQATPGMKAYANFADGSVTFAATGTPTGGATSTSSTIAPETSSVTGSITDDVLTVTVVGSGTLVPGSTLSGTNVVSGTQIVNQISGTAGGIGTYNVSIGEQAVASTTISGAYGLLTIGGTLAGTFGVGDVLSGSGVTSGTVITGLGTGVGGAGTYYVSPSQTVSSPVAISVAALNVETKWYARSSGLTGELVKISSQALG